MHRFNSRFYFFVIALFFFGLSSMIYRHVVYDIPYFPDYKHTLWKIEAKISFVSLDEPVKVRLHLPDDDHFTINEEFSASPGYGFQIVEEKNARVANWTKKNAVGAQEIYYTVNLYYNEKDIEQKVVQSADHSISVYFEDNLLIAVKEIIAQIEQKSFDEISFVQQLILFFNRAHVDENVSFLLNQYGYEKLLIHILNYHGIDAQLVSALKLEDQRRNQLLTSIIRVVYDNTIFLFDLHKGKIIDRKNLLLWNSVDNFVVDVIGGIKSKVLFSMLVENVSALTFFKEKMAKQTQLSLYNLPISEQNLLRGLFLIPIGVLIVVFFRVIVGLKTTGTFMPVLIALAFIQTKLLTGLLGFTLITAVGLGIRYYLSKMNLLLVARISVVVVVVIFLISTFSLFAYQFGLNKGLTISFFPMIILAWTIERMSILWEEEGGKHVFIQSGGSLLVASISYLVMDNHIVSHLAFNFIGLHLMILSCILLLGQYTGYRLLELLRFKFFLKNER